MELDKNIKNKLNTREIQPSANSWDRLDAMLSLEEKPKKKAFPFYYVAASVLFALGFTFWFANQSSEIIIPQNKGIVITDDNTSSQSDTIENSKQEIIVKGEMNTVVLVQQEDNLADKNAPKLLLNKKKSIVVENSKLAVSENKIQKSNKENRFISPEKLLASVENETQKETSIAVSNPNKNSVKVNPNSLLSSVEGEIDEEYRETTLDKLKRNFNQVKSAVANRNYE
ncbi:hypothetical protein [Flavobacterium sp.]|uniref:hypothetical protein n=1 Tax=Flavobacterium sp. TaxID=239 RepID=UPI003D27878F